jgi:2,4-dienoyl-CoA reductase-like NADH-dependent reductase (Old Yellow Enzyme family)/thioredoxin reductase
MLNRKDEIMMNPYSHILSPLQVRGKTFKTRLLQSKCALPPRDLETLSDFYVNTAKRGAAMVTVWIGNYPTDEAPTGHEAPVLGPSLEMTDPAVREAYRALNERVHAEGSLTSASLQNIEPTHFNISDTPNWDEIPARGDYNSMTYYNKPGISLEGIEKMMQDFVNACIDVQSLGFDVVTFYMSYRASILCNSLSPVLNQRTDQYGGKTNAERARLTVELFTRVREACPDLLIEVQCSGEEEAPGYTVSDWLDYCRAWEGLVDMIQVRGFDGSATHVSGVNMEEHCPPNLKFAAALREAGIGILVSPVGGFGDPVDIERFLSEGKCDFVSMARQFICDPHYYEKLKAGAPLEEFVPCIRCNDCHGRHRCPGNPLSLIGDKTFPEKPARSKKVAVIGGGPAGMLAAATAAERGHEVTLFEQADRLGGQLNLAAVPSFKWPLRSYRDYLIGKVERSGAVIKLNTTATPEMLTGFDAVICAVGSSPKRVPVPGADAPGVLLADDALRHPEQLGHRVVVIGGATTGRETAIFLAQNGHDVTMLTRTQAALFRDFHAQRAEEDLAELNPNFHYIEHCSVQEIGDGYLTATVKRGIPKVKLGFGGFAIPGHMGFDMSEGMWPIAQFDESNATTETIRLEFDSVVISGGRKANTELAEQFRGCAPEFYMVGDDVKPGDIRDGAGDAYTIAMSL